MLLVIGANTIFREYDSQIALVCVNGCHSHAGMCVDAAQNKTPNLVALKKVIQMRSKESAVAFLGQRFVTIKPVKQWMQLCSRTALNNNVYVSVPHFQKGVFQVFAKLGFHPDNRQGKAAKAGNQFVDTGQ